MERFFNTDYTNGMHESFLGNTNGHELFTNYFMNLFYTTDLTDKRMKRIPRRPLCLLDFSTLRLFDPFFFF